MFKFLLITAIVVYLIFKVGSFFFRMGAASQNLRRHQEQNKAGFNPKSSPGSASDSKVKGGEYIDYEEVK
jgi:hypothetical protein